MTKQELKEIKEAVQRLMDEIEELHERLEALELMEEDEEEDFIMPATPPRLPTPPRNPSPLFLPSRALMRVQSAPELAAPRPQQGSGWLCTLRDLASMSPRG